MFVESEDVLAHSFPQIHTYSRVNIFKGLVTDSFYYYYFSCESSHDAAVFTHSEASKHMGFFLCVIENTPPWANFRETNICCHAFHQTPLQLSL